MRCGLAIQQRRARTEQNALLSVLRSAHTSREEAEMSFWTRWAREETEYYAGRIRSMGSGWVFHPTPAQIKTTLKRNGALRDRVVSRTDADGKTMYLIVQRSVRCPWTEMCHGVYPRSERKDGTSYWHVPNRVCLKCQHRRKSDRQYRYPRCALKAVKNPKQAAAQSLFLAWNDAVSRANEMMGGTK